MPLMFCQCWIDTCCPNTPPVDQVVAQCKGTCTEAGFMSAGDRAYIRCSPWADLLFVA